MKKLIILACFSMLLSGSSSGGCGDEPPVDPLPDESPPTEPPPVTGCFAENCATGCCHNDKCYEGNATNACGSKGTACLACQGLEVCEANECKENRLTTWRVQPTAASIVAEDPRDGLSWDADDSPPDVVVELHCPSATAGQVLVSRTPEVESLNPTWTTGGCITEADALLRNPIRIRLIDIDNLFDDEIVSADYTITPDNLKNAGVNLTITGYADSLTLRLTRVQ